MFEKLIDKLSLYDVRHLLKTFASCQLLPINTERTIRLEALISCICSIPYVKDKPKAAVSTLKQITNTPQFGLDQVFSQEDPCEYLFTESLLFHGGNYIVFSGITDNVVFIVKNLLKGLFQSDEQLENEEFLKKASELTMAILLISDCMAKKANLTFGMMPAHSLNREVHLPLRLLEENYFNAVTFNYDDLQQQLIRLGIDKDILQPYVTLLGELSLDNYSPENIALHIKPFVKVENELIVSLPGILMATLRHALIVLAKEHSTLDNVARIFKNAIWHSATQSLERFKSEEIHLKLPQNEQFPMVKDSIFQLDRDKALHVLLISDPLTNYSVEEPFGSFEIKGIEKFIIHRIQEIRKFLYENSLGLNSVMSLLLLQSVGRFFHMGIDAHSDEELFLHFSVAELEIISLLDAGQDLALYKYARASRDLHKRCMVMVWSSIDEYAMYRSKDKSFYFSDDNYPNYVSISPDGAHLQQEAYQKTGIHGIASFEFEKLCEVVAIHGDKDIPIFAPLHKLGEDVALVTKGGFWVVWVVSEHRTSYAAQFVDLATYWLWQVRPELDKWFKDFEEMLIVFNLDFVPIEHWVNKGNLEITTDIELIQFDITSNRINLTINYSCSKLFESIDNSGDRYFLKMTLTSLLDFLQINYGIIIETDIDILVNQYAPLGLKKKLFVISTETMPILEAGTLPDKRYIDSADDNKVLDDIGQFLIETKKHSIGQIKPEERVPLLNDVVGYLFNRFSSTISTLRNDGLMSFLIAHYEALIRDQYLHKLTLPTRMACFSDKPTIIEQIIKELPESNSSSIALRFLIEYVAACPPKGIRPLSFEIFDELLAIGSQLVSWANYSDLINYKIADIKLSILKSRRLGIDKDNYQSAQNKFLIEHASGHLYRAFESYENKIISTDQPSESSSNFIEIQNAFISEFGISASELAEFISYLRSINTSSSVANFHYDELVLRIINELSWNEEKTKHVLSLLTLVERSEYLRPSKPFRKEDVYPWKFNRELSYLRRPLIQVNSTIYWGNRHLHYSGLFLFNLCLGGRLQAKTNTMKQLISKYQNENGEEFNDSVASWFENNTEKFITKKRVKKVGKLRIAGDNGDLGDIDVLVVDQRKKTVYVIECKDLATARNPYEIHYELTNLFIGSESKTSIAEKHSKRTNWIKEHLSEVLKMFGIENKGKWKVEPLLVVDEEMISPYLFPRSIKVMSFHKLKEEM